jgi:hypothetical protein
MRGGQPFEDRVSAVGRAMNGRRREDERDAALDNSALVIHGLRIDSFTVSTSIMRALAGGHCSSVGLSRSA